MLQTEGRVPVKWLLAMERKVRRERVDQAAGRELLNELPGSFTEVRFVTNDRVRGRDPTRPA